MKQYKFILTPVSSFSGMFSSDTLFGTVCWYVRYLFGEDALCGMLDEFKTSPPFLLSSLLPQGFLPRPQLPFGLKQSKEEIDRNKKLKKVQWIPLALFAKHQQAFSLDALAQEQNIVEKERALCEKLLPVEVTRNSVSRISGTVIEGILFTDSYLCAQGISFVVYVAELSTAYSDMLQRAFDLACQMGLGREASIGKGVFSVTKAELDDVEKKVFGAQGSHFMSISLCAGANLEPVGYTTFTKYGKLGGEFSQMGIPLANARRLLFHKKPIVFYKEGSAFVSKEGFGGTLLQGVHVDARIVQYAYAYPVYFTLAEKA